MLSVRYRRLLLAKHEELEVLGDFGSLVPVVLVGQLERPGILAWHNGVRTWHHGEFCPLVEVCVK